MSRTSDTGRAQPSEARVSLLDLLWLIGILAFIGYLFLQIWDDTFGEALRLLRERPAPKPARPRPFDWQRDMDA